MYLVECRGWTYGGVLVHEVGSMTFLNSLFVLLASRLFLLHLTSNEKKKKNKKVTLVLQTIHNMVLPFILCLG